MLGQVEACARDAD